MISYSFLERGGGAALQFPLSFDTLKSDFLYRNIKAWFSNNSFFLKKKQLLLNKNIELLLRLQHWWKIKMKKANKIIAITHRSVEF